MNSDQLTAIHEAGHAIAARLRGADVLACSVDPGLTTVQFPTVPTKMFRSGKLIEGAEPATAEDDGFFSWAGSWAEVRATLASSDARFADQLAATLKGNASDYAAYLAAEPPEGIEAQWSLELEHHWPYVVRVAQALYREHIEKLSLARSKRARSINRQTSRYRFEALRHARKLRETENLPPVAS